VSHGRHVWYDRARSRGSGPLSSRSAMEVTSVGTFSDNVARLKSVYRRWHESKGASLKVVEFHELYDTAALLAGAKP
jgi:hypothetical protein